MRLCFSLLLGALALQGQAPPAVRDLRITILSNNVARRGIGEWGFAALVETGGRRILFDTGAREGTVLQNVREMKIDLANVRDVVLSHNHFDHTAGLITLRREFRKQSADALSRVWVAEGMFYPRPAPDGSDMNFMNRVRGEFEALGGKFEQVSRPHELAPGVWLTGPVPRAKDDPGQIGGGRMRRPDGSAVADSVPEDMTMVFDTPRGLVVLTGCGHAGVINILEHARKTVRNARVHVLVGGLHLVNADAARLERIASKFKEFGVERFYGAHCTGIESTMRLGGQIPATGDVITLGP
jgi:7,8-dihydropterin-6-yl-methyl-4-(beta-D-ribofuranosyl)aminobenzene 5'-phosphate synthase